MAENLGNLFLNADNGFTDMSDSNHVITNNSVGVSTDHSVLEYSSAFRLTGTGQTITIPSSGQFTFGTGAFTVDFWLKWASIPSSFTIIKKSDHNNNYRTWEIRRGNNSKIEFTDGWPTGALLTTMYTGDNNWRHFAFVRQHTGGGGLKVYVNGVLNASVQEDRNFSVTSGLTLFGGMSNAYVDNIRVTKGQALWTSNFSLTEDDLFYPENDPIPVSSIYGLSSVKGNIRGKAKQGFVRPTVKQFFTSKDFEEVEKGWTNKELMDSSAVIGNAYVVSDVNAVWQIHRPGFCIFRLGVPFPNDTGNYYFEVEGVDPNTTVLDFHFGVGNSNFTTRSQYVHETNVTIGIMVNTNTGFVSYYPNGTLDASDPGMINTYSKASSAYFGVYMEGPGTAALTTVYTGHFNEDSFTYTSLYDSLNAKPLNLLPK